MNNNTDLTWAPDINSRTLGKVDRTSDSAKKKKERKKTSDPRKPVLRVPNDLSFSYFPVPSIGDAHALSFALEKLCDI